MVEEEIRKGEFVKEDTEEKTIYHYIDEELGIDFNSKVVFKKEDKFILYPFYQDKRTKEIKQKYHKIISFTFEGIIRLPAGFITVPSRGYGVTKLLKPVVKFIEKKLEAKNITISSKQKTSYINEDLIINQDDLNILREYIALEFRQSNEKNKVFVNNYFSKIFPSRFSKKIEIYQKGTINRIVGDYDAIKRRLSVEDKKALLNVFKKLYFSKKSIFEKQELISTKEEIEEKFIEDILKEFERLLGLKKIGEEKWQDFFKENPWIFSQLFAYPTVLFEDKAYVGGKTIENKDGKVVDFLYKNKLTKNSALIEIKKHTSKFISNKPYRGSDVYYLGKELSGAITQVLDQKDNYCKDFKTIGKDLDINSFNPKIIVIIGKFSSLNDKQTKSFELIRSSLKDGEIITFDELYMRIKLILNIFKKK